MKLLKSVSALAIASALLTGTAAANPIDSVSIQKNGIDVVPIEVTGNGKKFTSIKTQSHKFGLKLYAKANWGKKVRRATVGSGNVVMFEYMTKWNASYSNNSRTFQKTISPTIAMGKLTFSGNDPVKACNAKLASHRNALVTGTTTQVSVLFELAATTKSKLSGNTSSKTKETFMWYPVTVKCLPSGVNKKFLSN